MLLKGPAPFLTEIGGIFEIKTSVANFTDLFDQKLVNHLKILANFRGKVGNTEIEKKKKSNYRFFFLSSGEL